MLNIKKIREDFPALSVERNEKPIIYLDSACMALKPKSVIQALKEYYEEHTACGGRSHHYFGLITTKKCEEAREKFAKFINAETPEECIWVRNATEAINYIANGLSFKTRDTVISEDSAHNSNLIPWMHLQEQGKAKHQLLSIDLGGKIDLDELSVLLSNKTRLVSLCHLSNVLGSTIPVREIISIAHDHGAYVLLDSAQSFPHRKIDVQKLDVDFMAVSMHKACGPTGIGVLYGKKLLLEELNQTLLGGETVADVFTDRIIYAKIPYRFEAGLQNYAGMIAAGAAVDYLGSLGMEAIEEHERKLSQRLLKGIKNLPFPFIKLLGSDDPDERCALASLYLGNVNPHEVSMMLDEMANLFLRAGFHCTHAFHHKHGLDNGTLRPSFYLYNTEEEVDLFLETLEEVLSALA
ncbi:MAG: aminotransferase class V-fold PLP-dependent enzyme [Candidatus Hodarchaeota archaeon]